MLTTSPIAAFFLTHELGYIDELLYLPYAKLCHFDRSRTFFVLRSGETCSCFCLCLCLCLCLCCAFAFAFASASASAVAVAVAVAVAGGSRGLEAPVSEGESKGASAPGLSELIRAETFVQRRTKDNVLKGHGFSRAINSRWEKGLQPLRYAFRVCHDSSRTP
jgi:hypothetical protein